MELILGLLHGEPESEAACFQPTLTVSHETGKSQWETSRGQ